MQRSIMLLEVGIIVGVIEDFSIFPDFYAINFAIPLPKGLKCAIKGLELLNELSVEP